MNAPSIEALFRIGVVRLVVAALFLSRGMLFLVIGKRYKGMNDLCWVVRVADIGWLQATAGRLLFREIERSRLPGHPSLIDAYHADSSSVELIASYAIGGGGPHDLFRDLIVLKKPSGAEKGVILLKYARTFSAVAALLDLPALSAKYFFVLEPCWTGYCDPALLMFSSAPYPVIVQCFTESDHKFIESVGRPFVPVRLGPADWVNSEIFRAPLGEPKSYDLVMVANWAAHKRHAQLFRSLGRIAGRKVRVLLIGFSWANRTADDIRKEAAMLGGSSCEIEILERVPQAEISRYLSRCKVFVFLSRKEGDNKALVEAMFADVPAIVYDKSIGGARSRINGFTGVLSSDEDLHRQIVYMLDHYGEFTPRAWALEHSGSSISTDILNEAIRRAVLEVRGVYTRQIVEKVNSPNLAYKNPQDRLLFKEDYDFVMGCLRAGPPRRIEQAANMNGY